ncbi:MAG TPA: M1 family aminopeptidase, partial [Chloroflexota bacterium]
MPEEQQHPFNLPGDSPHYGPDRCYRAEHLRLEMVVYPDEKRLEGTATYTLRRAAVMAEPAELVLDAADMQVLDVSPARSWSHSEDKLHVEPAMADADELALSIRYAAQPSKGMYFLEPDDGYPNRPRQIWTQGQAEDTRYWLPSFDFPNQKLTTELIATVPGDLTVVSNGELVSHEGSRWHFRQEVPHPAYLMTFAAGHFSRIEDRWRDVPVLYYVEPGREEDAERAFGNTPAMIDFFSSATGVPYPYAKYAQVAVADFVYGGMENTSATTQTDRTLHDARAHLDFSSDPLVSHELAHQWFGDLVTCRDWGHAWLNESFATYCEALWREHHLGRDEFLYDLHGLLHSYLGEARQRYMRPIATNVYREPSDVFDRHLYEKGGLVLHMLRMQLGDAAWWASIKHYLESHRGGNVATQDLQRAVEDVTGRNLEGFFQQWVFSPGHPQLKVSYSWDRKARLASVSVKQTQDTKHGTPEYRLDFNLAFDDYLVPVHLDAPERTVAVHLEREPRLVRLAPGGQLALKTADLELPSTQLKNQLAEDEDVPLRVDAAKALGKKADREAVSALAGALLNDRFWGVQRQVALALADARTHGAKQTLLGAIGLPHPKARRGVIEGLGAFREPDVAEALQEKATKGDESYLVEAETLRSLGRTRQSGVYETLVGGLERESHDEVIRQAVFDGLKELRDDRAVDVALEWMRYGKPNMARAAAVRSLEKLREDDSRVDDALTDLLEDQRIASRFARGAAINVLRRRKKADAIPALERVAERDVDERIRRSAREALRALRQGQDREEELRQLRERLDDLAEQNRKLRDRVDKLETRRESCG